MRPRSVCTCAEKRIRIGTVDKWTATKVSEGPSMCWGVLLIHVLLITIRLIMLISWQERTQILMAVSWLISCELYFLQHDSRYQLRCRPSITPVNWLGCLCTLACLPSVQDYHAFCSQTCNLHALFWRPERNQCKDFDSTRKSDKQCNKIFRFVDLEPCVLLLI